MIRYRSVIYHPEWSTKWKKIVISCRFYSAEIILALHFLHSRGIIYRYDSRKRLDYGRAERERETRGKNND